jgi:hypothetical protein
MWRSFKYFLYMDKHSYSVLKGVRMAYALTFEVMFAKEFGATFSGAGCDSLPLGVYAHDIVWRHQYQTAKCCAILKLEWRHTMYKSEVGSRCHRFETRCVELGCVPSFPGQSDGILSIENLLGLCGWRASLPWKLSNQLAAFSAYAL